MNCILIEKRDVIIPLMRRASRLSASGGDGNASTTRESDLNSQLDTLKEDTKAAFADAMERVQALALEEHGNGGDPSSTKTTALQGRLQQAIEDLTGGLIERDTEVRLLLLAALSQEHVLYLGPPGTAKSELGRRLSKLCGGSYFERLLTRFSVPEELFGPLSMHALENDEYIRQVHGYLPTADVAFIDEIV